MSYQPAYDTPENFLPGKRSVLAIVSMVLGIIALLPLVGIPFAIAAIICSIIALVKISGQPHVATGKGFALAGLITGIIGLLVTPVIGLLFAILLPSLGKARELANRSTCAANQRGIVQSMIVYGFENNRSYPVVMPPATPNSYRLAIGSATRTSEFDALSTYYAESPPNAAGSVPANLWLLVLTNECTPKQFICKSDPGPTTVAQVQVGGSGPFNTNFNGPNPDFAYSYSINYPWTSDEGGTPSTGAWWRDTTDSYLPVISDMAPLEGTGTSLVTQTAAASKGAIPANGLKAWNSPNHMRDGQNVTFADCHTEFSRRPDIGPGGDNIFTVWNGTFADQPGSAVTTPGSVGSGRSQTTVSPYDVFMVPRADCTTFQRE